MKRKALSKVLKSFLCLLLAVVMLTGVLPPAWAAERTEDEPVVGSGEISLLSTVPQGVIVSDNVTRAEWMQNLVLLFDMSSTVPEYTDIYFPDLTAETEYFEAIMLATAYGVVDIEAGGNFDPTGALTREFAAQTLNYCLGVQKSSDTYSYSDTADVTYQDDAQVAVELGWFALVGGKFLPDQAVTAAEITAMLNSVQEVLDGRDVSESVQNYEFADYVKVLPETAVVTSSIDMETMVRTVTVGAYDGTLAVGDTFVYFYDGFAFVHGVGSVSKTNGVYTIVTTDAPEDAILNYEFTGTIEPEIINVVPNTETVTFDDADGSTVTVGKTRGITIKNNEVKFENDLFKSNGLKGTLTGKIVITGLDTHVSSGHIYGIVKGKVEISSTLEFDAINDPAAKSLHLAGVELAGFGYVGLELSLQMKASIGYTYTATFEVGAEYQNGAGYLIRNFKASEDNCLRAEGTVSAKLALTAYVDLGPCGFAMASIGAGPVVQAGLKRYAGGTPSQCITISGYLYAGASFVVKFTRPMTRDVVYQLEKKWDFYNATNSPVKYWEHIEDGVTVSACTRSKDSGTITGEYAAPRYTSPSNSRYYSSSNKNASSSGTNSYGEEIVIWTTEDLGGGIVAITGYSGNASVLNIPETIDGNTVTAIGANAFKNKTSLRIVNIPDTVTSIGNSAFYGCTGLTHIDIPDSVTSIKGYAFSDCTNLATVKFSENLTELAEHAFDNTALINVELPESLLYLGRTESNNPYYSGATFYNCKKLESVYIPSTLLAIGGNGAGTFEGCTALTDIVFGEGMAEIPDYLFYDAPITNVDIPDTVTSIGYHAFRGCTNLTAIEIPNGVEEIESYTFYNCAALSTVTMPDTVTSIGSYAFYGSGITNLDWLPRTVTEIGSNAFRDCTALLTVVLPDGLTKLNEYTFTGCTALTSVTTGADLKTIGNYAFQDCTALTELNLNDGLTSIGSYGFQNCKVLETVVLPDSVTSLGSYVFQKAAKLSNVTLSNGLKEIPSYGFANCTSLTELVIPKGVTTIKDNAFYQNTKLKTFTIPVTVTSIGSNAFSYAATTTVRGVAGSYAESFAKWKTFEDITVPATGINLANGTDAMTIGRYLTVTPKFVFAPNNSTDAIETLTSADTGIVSVRNGTQLYGSRTGTTTVTATTYSGMLYTFTVTVDTLSGIEIASKPTKTVYALNGRKDLTGLVVNAVFAGGGSEQVYDYTVSGFKTDVGGIHTVTVTYNNKTAEFKITAEGPVADGLHQGQDGVWRYYLNGEIAVGYNGLVQHTNGAWYYVKSGVLNTGTGLVQHTDGKWYYVSKGIWNNKATGLVQHTDKKWYYIKNGVLSNTTGLVQHTDGKWRYVKNGVLTTATGLVQHTDGRWYYVKGGVWNNAVTGLVQHTDKKWYYVKGGVWNNAVTGMVQHTDKQWYYVTKGVWNQTAKGMTKHTDGKWYYIVGGKLATNYSGLVQHTDKKWYNIVKGALNTSYTGLVQHTDGKWYYVAKGVFNSAYNGVATTPDGTEYTVVKGVAQP